MNLETRIDWLGVPAASLDAEAQRAARDRQATLTKPHGSLGRLEEIAIRLAALQGTPRPLLDRVRITVFVGDHGVAAEGVSAFPQAVTAEMIKNFAGAGGHLRGRALPRRRTRNRSTWGRFTTPGPWRGSRTRRWARVPPIW